MVCVCVCVAVWLAGFFCLSRTFWGFVFASSAGGSRIRRDPANSVPSIRSNYFVPFCLALTSHLSLCFLCLLSSHRVALRIPISPRISANPPVPPLPLGASLSPLANPLMQRHLVRCLLLCPLTSQVPPVPPLPSSVSSTTSLASICLHSVLRHFKSASVLPPMSTTAPFLPLVLLLLLMQRLCWALCALRAFDPAVAGDSWSPAEVTALLQRALERVETDQPASLVLLPVSHSCLS